MTMKTPTSGSARPTASLRKKSRYSVAVAAPIAVTTASAVSFPAPTIATDASHGNGTGPRLDRCRHRCRCAAISERYQPNESLGIRCWVA
jgi:hypothetical protein